MLKGFWGSGFRVFGFAFYMVREFEGFRVLGCCGLLRVLRVFRGLGLF